MIKLRSESLEQTWEILDLNTQKARDYPVGHIFNIMTNGINTMPPYRSQIPVEDRWAIVAWVRALQYSQAVEVSQLPPDVQGALRARKPRDENPKDVMPTDVKPIDQQPKGTKPGGK